MKCKISCSFIDKKTILSIKKIKDKDALKNISLELELLLRQNKLNNWEI